MKKQIFDLSDKLQIVDGYHLPIGEFAKLLEEKNLTSYFYFLDNVLDDKSFFKQVEMLWFYLIEQKSFSTTSNFKKYSFGGV